MTHFNKYSRAILSSVLLISISFSAMSEQHWFLFDTDGKCMEIESLKSKVPDLPQVTDPNSFVQFMHQKGIKASSTEITTTKPSKITVVEVSVPEKELSLMFVPYELCPNFKSK